MINSTCVPHNPAGTLPQNVCHLPHVGVPPVLPQHLQINSGNSGGPAFNEAGECVGIAFQSLKVCVVEGGRSMLQTGWGGRGRWQM